MGDETYSVIEENCLAEEYMKVSVVVPVYNVELYLQQCVESLLKQTYTDIEIILVDDGSKDSSGTMCDSFAEQYPEKIKSVHKSNEGLGLARNTGMEYVTGEFVTFIDSDDYVDKNLIEQLVKSAEEHYAQVVVGGFKRVNSAGDVLFTEKYDLQVFTGDDVKNKMFMRMLGSSPEKSDAIRMSVWNAMYSTQIMKQHNAKFPSERELISEDIIFDSEFYPNVQCGVIIPSVAYNYRVNEQSLTGKYRPDRFEKVIILYKELEKRIKALNMPEIAAFRAQRQLFVNIRGCIRQENIKCSGLTKKQAYQNIEKICMDAELLNIIDNYPVKKLGRKQKMFLNLIKRKKSGLLYIMLCR